MAELTSNESLPDCIFGKAGSKSCKSEPTADPAGTSPLCPQCGSKKLYRSGLRYFSDSSPIQRWLCRDCSYRFSEKPPQKNPKWSINTQTALPSRSQICATNQEAKNLDSTQKTEICADKERHTPTDNEIKAAPQIEKLLIQLKNDGRKAVTVINYRKALRVLLRAGADLYDPENTKAVLAKLPMKDSSKKTIVTMLNVWFEFNCIGWKAPKYSDDHVTPYIPTEAEIDQLIAALGKKTSVFCQMLKDTGARCGELSALKWTDVDFGQRKVRIKGEKGSNSRVLPLSAKTIDMLCNLPRDKEIIFAGTSGLRANFFIQRRRIARRIANPNIALIHFHTFRHWKATTEQHKTKDPWHVKMILGHKSIQSTETYIHLEKMMYNGDANDQFTVKVADTLEDVVKLMEVGFEFHAEVEGHKLFRKRK